MHCPGEVLSTRDVAGRNIVHFSVPSGRVDSASAALKKVEGERSEFIVRLPIEVM